MDPVINTPNPAVKTAPLRYAGTPLKRRPFGRWTALKRRRLALRYAP